MAQTYTIYIVLPPNLLSPAFDVSYTGHLKSSMFYSLLKWQGEKSSENSKIMKWWKSNSWFNRPFDIYQSSGQKHHNFCNSRIIWVILKFPEICFGDFPPSFMICLTMTDILVSLTEKIRQWLQDICPCYYNSIFLQIDFYSSNTEVLIDLYQNSAIFLLYFLSDSFCNAWCLVVWSSL